MERLQLSDGSDVDEDLWTSPKKPQPSSQQTNASSRNREMSYEEKGAHEEALRRELESVRKVNEAIEGIIESLDKARNSMKVQHGHALDCFIINNIMWMILLRQMY